jgi:hypothetical protein
LSKHIHQFLSQPSLSSESLHSQIS